MLLSGKLIPYEQNEYAKIGACEKCKTATAVECLVCEMTLCNNCRNILYPYKEADGTLVFHDAHPVQCECTVIDFQLALMRARKAERVFNITWSQVPENEKIAPLAAICFTRSLATLIDTSATALDYHHDENHVKGGLNVAIISKGEESLDPSSKGESDGDEYRAILEASSAGSYYNLRIQDRQHITGATSPPELENIKEATALSIAIRVVREILAFKDVPKDQELHWTV